MKTKHHSYGIIPIYKDGNNIFICCVHNKKSNDWGLLKGTPEGNETPFETASRELHEETGIKDFDIIGGKTFEEEYTFEIDGIVHEKINTYYIASVTSMIDKALDIDSKDMRWIDIKSADSFFKFSELIKITSDVLDYMTKFPLVQKYLGRSGEEVIFEHYNSDSIEHLKPGTMSQVQIMAFHGDKLLIVNNTEWENMYTPVGGGIEPGETPEECLPRELQEESNMRVVGEPRLIGYQSCKNLTRPDAPIKYQLRYYAKVEPIGPFDPSCDPDGDVTELLEINPTDYKKYFDWGTTGDEIINRAIEFHGLV